MKIVIAPDSFKESMSAKIACKAIVQGIQAVNKEHICYQIPMADGGEGTMQSICDAMQGKIITIPSYNVFKEPITMPLGLCKDVIIIESASCIGLDKIPIEQRNIWLSSTYGLGIAIKTALSYQPKKIILCLGGSATNDMGTGMLQALGVRFFDNQHREVDPIPASMHTITDIDITSLDPRLSRVEIIAACDVQNPLCGVQGASYIFGPQKGATPEDVKKLDTILQTIGTISSSLLQKDIINIPGGGAAGGLGSALYGFLQATLKPGVEIVKEAVKLEEYMKGADMVITGEGSLDSQTLQGKTCFGVIQSAKKYHLPVLIFAGNIDPSASILYTHGVTAYFPIVSQVKPIDEILALGPQNLANAVENVFRLGNIGVIK